MSGVFSAVVPNEMTWLAELSPVQDSAVAVILAILLAALLTWLSQFRRRHVGTVGLLQAFAACGLLVLATLPLRALAILPGAMAASASAVLHLVLFALFCLVAIRTQPASEQVEAAL